MKTVIKKYLGALMTGTALMAVPSCTDTWNEHYRTEDQHTASNSLWELLEAEEDLSNFRSVVAKARYYRDEHHPAFTIEGNDTVYYTFKDVLNANALVTVWAPRNEALTAEEWKNLENMAENDGYNLQQQFIGNHIALYRKTMAKTGEETFRLINNKFATVNYDEQMLQKTHVLRSDIGARNGLLHVIDSRNEFLYNLYEYIKYSGEVPTFGDYLVKRDTVYFLESASIEGLPDEDGNPTYVDSVYFNDNLMFSRSTYDPTTKEAPDMWMGSQKMFRARLNAEDSVFVMIVPTDEAWAKATAKLEPFYNYVTVYPNMDKTNLTTTKDAVIDIYGSRPAFPNGKGYETLDSLRATNINMDIVSPLVFNVNLQPQKDGKEWTLETFMDGGYNDCEYLLTTVGDTIRDIYEDVDGEKVLVWEKKSLFEGNDIVRKEMSNGYALVSDNWKFPRDYWMRDIEVEANEYSSMLYDQSTATRVKNYDINNSVASAWIDQYGRCSRQQYLHVYGSSSSTNPEVTFRLYDNINKGSADVMSGKYDVQIVMVPRWYETSEEEADIPEDGNFDKNRLVCTLYYWDESLIGGKDLKYTKQKKIESKPIEYSGEKVDTITVLEDVVFPVAYKNLYYAYPVLQVKCDKLSSADTKNKYSRQFNIDRIILKSKEAAE